MRARQEHRGDRLVGSLAAGGATPSSDADLLIVLRHDGRRVIDRVPEYSRPFEGVGLPVQAIPWTEAELAVRLAEDDPWAREIVRTGATLAGYCGVDRAGLRLLALRSPPIAELQRRAQDLLAEVRLASEARPGAAGRTGTR